MRRRRRRRRREEEKKRNCEGTTESRPRICTSLTLIG
jgi:hypothetical protein